jgi:hypothetical protein
MCVNLMTDPDYCGDCFTACDTNEECNSGICELPCGDLVYSTDAACQSCMETACCNELANCSTGTACGDLLDCVEACAGDTTCQDGCMQTHSLGLTAAQALLNCDDNNCDTECALPGACGTTMSYTSEVLTQCVTDNCCATFDPCFNDPDCNACLLNPEGAGCGTNTLFNDYLACMDTHCPTGICGTTIGFYAGQDPMIDCNICLTGSCCTHMEACVGDESPAAITLCIDCLNDPSGTACTDPTISAAAAAMNTCTTDNCATQCQ